MNRPTTSALAVLALSAIAAWPAAAAVPTATDFAACNMKAAEGVASDAASASPRSGLPPDATKLPPDVKSRSDVVMPPSTTGKVGRSTDPTGTTLSSDKDPQVEGMAADRASDPVYVAAYRSCMRQRGF